jgi:hypothetical protein
MRAMRAEESHTLSFDTGPPLRAFTIAQPQASRRLDNVLAYPHAYLYSDDKVTFARLRREKDDGEGIAGMTTCVETQQQLRVSCTGDFSQYRYTIEEREVKFVWGNSTWGSLALIFPR